MLVYKIPRIKYITFTLFSLNTKSFFPFLLWEEGIEVQEQVNSHSQIKLPSLKHKESMNKSKQTLWPNSSITCLIQDRIQFNTSELVLETCMYTYDCTQTVWWFWNSFFFSSRCLSCYYLSVLKREKILALCAKLQCCPCSWHCVISLMKNISIFWVSVLGVGNLGVWASGKQKAARMGCSAVGPGLKYFDELRFSAL